MEKTVIIQGEIQNNMVQRSINQIREWFDGELIISTWEGQNNNLSGYDKILFCKDPGPGPFNGLLPVQQHCNLKRQLYGLKKALEESSNDLIFKIRNDCLVTKNIFSYFNFEKAFGEYKIFDSKVVVSNMMTINPDSTSEPKPWFRISDWFYLGMKEDIKKICDVYDDLEKTDFSNSFFGTEHILSFNLIKKYIYKDLTLEDYITLTRDSWKYILNNYKVIDTKSTAGIINIGKWINQPEYLSCYLTEEQYKERISDENYIT
jgi:hypothetical protein